MYFGKKNSEEPVVIMEDTVVYACASEACNGWMRKEFAADNETCPMCGDNLTEEIRELPKIQNEYNAFR
ncbi:cold-inducible protein YdjO-related protein [Bacillus sp. V59.32b]|uniref:cold-inducible protein YdjO-related protein n=1 Tax=Bacillus sp. V59.32b TaxID=1758642 RepID=UPI000E3C4D53|nr:cold-inducible protein YdjO-related protein [Bacillus sp. V59.32b]RFU68243.1 hypothetical protein D0463_05680 [Bacillus sp. V59.32b]